MQWKLPHTIKWNGCIAGLERFINLDRNSRRSARMNWKSHNSLEWFHFKLYILLKFFIQRFTQIKCRETGKNSNQVAAFEWIAKVIFDSNLLFKIWVSVRCYNRIMHTDWIAIDGNFLAMANTNNIFSVPRKCMRSEWSACDICWRWRTSV